LRAEDGSVPALRVAGTFDGAPITFALSENLIDDALVASAISDDWRTYQPQTGALVLEHLLGDIISTFEDFVCASIYLETVSISDAEPDLPTLVCDVIGEDGAKSLVWLIATQDVLESLLQHSIRYSATLPEKDASAVSLPCKIFGPQLKITTAELSACRVGDGLLVQTPQTGITAHRIVVEDQFYADLEAEDGRLTVLSDLSPLQDQQPAAAQGSGMAEDCAADDTVISLDVLLAETTLSAQDIRSLSSGSIVPCASPNPSDVTLINNNTAFARANIVQFGRRTALRLTQIG